jgi:chorismate synthase
VIVEGFPSGIAVSAAAIDLELRRRQLGYGRGGRMKIESDSVVIESGVRGGESLGSPITLRIENKDFANWKGRMGAERFEEVPAAVTLPRPGHADLAGVLKYDRTDARDILERASARETAARTAVGALAKILLRDCGIKLMGRVCSIGTLVDRDADELTVAQRFALVDTIEASSVRVCSPDVETAMRALILETSHRGDTLGGVIEVLADGVPPGLGSHVHWDRRLDGRIAQAAMSIQAIKAVEIGDGWAAACHLGSLVHDPIAYDSEQRMFTRSSNHAGGIEGGMSNGQPICVRAAMKPIATLKRPLASADLRTKEQLPAAHERSDVCAVPAASVVLEAMVAIVLADATLEKFGSDSRRELLRSVSAYQQQLREY